VGETATRSLPGTVCEDIALSPDGKTLAVALKPGGLKFLDPTTEAEKEP
jgi:hypothetical protein